MYPGAVPGADSGYESRDEMSRNPGRTAWLCCTGATFFLCLENLQEVKAKMVTDSISLRRVVVKFVYQVINLTGRHRYF
jgi:hypothetical protein